MIAEALTGSVLTLTLDRPERANALDLASMHTLLDRFRALAAAPGEARAVLLRGEGRHLCSGADLGGTPRGEGADRPPTGSMVRRLQTGAHALVEAVFECPLPVVAAAKGRSAGLGLHLALAADLVVASVSATFAEPFADRGFSVDSGGSWLLSRRIGLGRATAMLYLGDAVDAPTAMAWGLVHEVVPDTDLDHHAGALAARLATRPTLALSTTKRLLHDHLDATLHQALQAEAMAVEVTLRSDDFKEGLRAYTERRPPDFRGR